MVGVIIVLSVVVLTMFPTSYIAMRTLKQRSEKEFRPIMGAVIFTALTSYMLGTSWDSELLAGGISAIGTRETGILIFSVFFYISFLLIFIGIAIGEQIADADSEQ